jgi:hypothetical protein
MFSGFGVGFGLNGGAGNPDSSKCGCIELAVYTFEATTRKRMNTWNAMLTDYTVNEHCHKAIELLARSEGIITNKQSYLLLFFFLL